MRPSVPWGISRRFHRLSPGRGQVAHVLRTLPPVAATGIATRALPLDLHVLSLPLAFILSQDQTLLCIFSISLSLSPLPHKRNQRSRFCLVLLVLACTFRFSLFNDLSSLALKKPALRLMASPVRFVRDCKGNRFFFNLQNFLRNFFRLFLQRTFSIPSFPKGTAKVVTFSELANYFYKKF